jgi:tetratricopeptide (TPR) repeat protein
MSMTYRIAGISAALTILSAVSGFAQKSTREQLAEAVKPMYEANMRSLGEYNCNMALINLDRRNILDRMNGKMPPVARYDSIIAKATECINSFSQALPYDYRAKAYMGKGDSKAALEDFGKAIAAAKKESGSVMPVEEIYEDRADYYIKLGDRDKAEADLREATKLNPSRSSAKDKLDHLDQKIADARKAQALANPQTAADYIIAGTENYNSGKYDKALAAYDKAIALSPSAAAYVGKGKVLRAQNKTEPALTELNKALSISPGDAEALECRGYAYRDLKRWDDAIADFTKAIALNSKPMPYLLHARGTAYTGKGDYTAALKDHDAAIAVADDVYAKVTALSGKADALRAQGKVDEALNVYNTAVATAGDDYFAKLNLYDAYLGRGQIYASQGKTDMAKADFNAILKMMPNDKEAKAALAKLSAGNDGTATGTKTAEAWAIDGRYAANSQKWDEAVTAFTECIRLAPDSPGCYAFRGAVLGMKGNLSASRTDFDKALKLSKNNPMVFFMRAQMYMQLGKKPEAIEDLRAVLKIVPGNPQATQALQALGEKP